MRNHSFDCYRTSGEINFYRSSIKSHHKDDKSYKEFWKPISDKLAKMHKSKSKERLHVYFSADGVYNQLNLNTLFNSSSQKYLFEEVDISLLTNTKDLLVVKQEEAFNNLAYLFGYPDYGLSIEARSKLIQQERSNQPLYYSLSLERGNNLIDLPGF